LSFSVVSALAAAWAAVTASTGGSEFLVAGVRLSSHSARNPLILSIACGLLAWALSLARPPQETLMAPAPRGPQFTGLLVLMVVAVNVMLLAQPAAPLDEHNCVFDNDAGIGFRHMLNCDSPLFLALAKDPSMVFGTRGATRQSRPLSFLVPFLIAQPLRLVPGLEDHGPYRPYAREFMAYALVNLAALTAALMCFTWAFERGTRRQGGPELLLCLVALAANDVTKIFFWTPHVQIFNVLVPCLSLYLGVRLIDREEPLTVRQAALLGLAFGTTLLLYGSFFIPVLCCSAIQLLVYRRPKPALVLAAVSFIPSLAWILFVYAVVGSFYNYEVEAYRQFIWLSDCLRSADGCAPAITSNLLTFFNTTAPVLVIPGILVVASRLARLIWSAGDVVEQQPPPRALGQSIAITFTITLVFLALMGFYVPRLSWLLVPPLLLLAAVEVQGLRFSRPQAQALGLSLAAMAAALAHVLILAARQGPYK
jgi:hypothetical protein